MHFTRIAATIVGLARLGTAAWLAILCAACASSTSPEADPGASVDAGPTTDAPPRPLRSDASPPSVCTEGEFAVGVDADGTLQCAPIAPTATDAVRSHCALYAGWRDSCNGCTNVPAKWGSARHGSCATGLGADNTCSAASLGGINVSLFGLNTDGDVNDDDKFYLGWQCDTPPDAPIAGPCAAGSFISAITADGIDCITARGMIVEYLRANCHVYLGWRDSCNGCTGAPAKWAHASSTSCDRGVGVDNTCTMPTLAGASVRLLGVNTDGDVGGDDKFYLGFQCSGATTASEVVSESCPPGQLVVGRDGSGVHCASPLPLAETAVQQSCSLYFGWRDNCDGCTTPPAKWGRVGHAFCENGFGADNTCSVSTLAGNPVQLFGLNTDGDVNGDDKFHVGLACP